MSELGWNEITEGDLDWGGETWTDSSDPEYPRSRFLREVLLCGVPHHLELIQVVPDPIGIFAQVAADPDLDGTVADLMTALGVEKGFQTIEIDGLRYIAVMTPYGV